MSKPQHSSRMSEGEFAAVVVDRLRGALPHMKVEPSGRLHLQMQPADGSTHNIFLDNAYKEYVRSPSGDADAVVERYARSFVEVANGFTPSHDAIVPIIKTRSWAESMAESPPGGDPGSRMEFIQEGLNEDLVILYALDGASNIKYLKPMEFDRLGVPVQRLRSLAIGNLRQRIPRLEIHRGDAVSMVVAGGNFEASLLLFEDLWEREAEKLKGEMVVALPTRDLLLFADSAKPENINVLRSMAVKQFAEGAYPLTDRLFVRRSGKFIGFS